MPSEKVQSKKWADDSDEEEETPTETFEDGIKTVTEYKTNDKGQRVKVIKKIKVYTKTVKVNKNVEARKKWKKFGECAGAPHGTLEDGITSTSLEEFNLSLGGTQKEEQPQQPTASATAICRNCGRTGDHWTLQCPFKSAEARKGEKEEEERASATTGGVKKKAAYVPPNMREGASASADDGGRGRRGDDFPTVRVTNLSEDTKESDLAELFRPFGPISRIYLAKDKDSNASRGFAFVSFIRKEDAARAIAKLSGHGYDHLILHLEWAKPSK